jgi:hypothetical protein
MPNMKPESLVSCVDILGQGAGALHMRMIPIHQKHQKRSSLIQISTHARVATSWREQRHAQDFWCQCP